MKKRRTQNRKRTIWTKDGSQTQVTLFRPQAKERAMSDPVGGPKKRKPRKKFLLGKGFI